MLTKDDMVTLEGSYGREALINIVRTTKYYLRRALSSEGLQYKGYPVRIKLCKWGRRGVNGTYHVCIASLWYLMEKGDEGYLMVGGPTVLVPHVPCITVLALFLDSMRYPLLGNKAIRHLLGVNMLPYYAQQTLRWDSEDPHCVLEFMDALVAEYDAPPPIPYGYRGSLPYLLDEPVVGADLPGYVTGAHYRVYSKPTHPPLEVER